VGRPDPLTRTIRWLRYEGHVTRRELAMWHALLREHEGTCRRCAGSEETNRAFCEQYWALFRRTCELGGWLDVVAELSATS
jgi:hypothetical protein